MWWHSSGPCFGLRCWDPFLLLCEVTEDDLEMEKMRQASQTCRLTSFRSNFCTNLLLQYNKKKDKRASYIAPKKKKWKRAVPKKRKEKIEWKYSWCLVSPPTYRRGTIVLRPVRPSVRPDFSPWPSIEIIWNFAWSCNFGQVKKWHFPSFEEKNLVRALLTEKGSKMPQNGQK